MPDYGTIHIDVSNIMESFCLHKLFGPDDATGRTELAHRHRNFMKV
jgi:hypothetical protein